MTMRTREEMREYQRSRRETIDRMKRAKRNLEQAEQFKTVGGRAKYYANTKTPKRLLGKYFNESGERKINGVAFYGFCL